MHEGEEGPSWDDEEQTRIGSSFVSRSIDVDEAPATVAPVVAARANAAATAPRSAEMHAGASTGPDAAVAEERRKIAEARAKGYEGEGCSSCQSFTLVRNGTCMKCMTCGNTSGCS
jgi:ribonucleoside-diphosphate reductase alpha chain